MRSIVVANQKGGCAKTTTIVNLAASLAEGGQRVLVVDLDPQANATQWLGCSGPQDGSYRLFLEDGPLEDLWSATHAENIKVIGASQHLSSVERALAGRVAIDSILKRRLSRLKPQQWDFVLIDTPPTLSLVTLNALSYAKELLIPVTTHILTLSGVAQLMATVETVKSVLNPDLEILGFLPSRVNQRTRHSKDVLDLLVEEFGPLVLNSKIRESIRLAESPSFQQAILTYDDSSGAAADYRALSKEILSRRATRKGTKS
jgi:chromosome partitioning protein